MHIYILYIISSNNIVLGLAKKFRMGATCTPVANSCQCMAKPLQYCKVISLQLNKLKRKKKKEKDAGEVATLATVHTKCAVLVAMSVFPLPIPEAGEAVCSAVYLVQMEWRLQAPYL